MIYLIAQMFVALVLAGILGVAIGWLIHRAAHAKRLDETRHALARAQNQVAQTESEVAMLSDDYDELQRRSKDEVSSLRTQNQQIPILTTNLEKSQLLVKQQMQKHESRTRELSTENSNLSAKLKSITDREQAYGKVKVELDNIRTQKMADNRQSSEATDGQKSNDSEAYSSDSDEPGFDTGKLDESIDAADLNESTNAADLDKSTNAADLDELTNVSSLDESTQVTDLDKSTNVTSLDESASEQPSEQLDATVKSGPADDFINKLNEASRLPISDARTSGSWASAALTINADRTDEQMANAHKEVIGTDDDPFDSVMEVGDELQRELDIDTQANPLLDGSSDNASLFEFEPVEHQDDLKQIFGIGPVTEKALNDLGITSYSQLAELQSHDIEKIADALSFVPGRIEQDDWVGNARQQLEDVLEDL